MVKQQAYQQWYIDEEQDAMENYDDDHYNEFYDFLFYELLINIKKIPFDYIIQNYLQADRKLINSTTIYSFRFANTCHPEFYKAFEIKAHHLFETVMESRHKYYGWYKYKGHALLNDVDKYLNIGKVVQSQIPHKTKVFINQKQERLDIQFHFYSINERIAICFEPAYPA